MSEVTWDNIKSRDLPLIEYLDALQREWMCTQIRFQLYERDLDKNHFKKVMDKKEQKILSIASREDVHSTIFDDNYLYKKFWHDIIPSRGMPRFIYNERVLPEAKKRQHHFPYSGTMVRISSEQHSFKFGVSDYVDFDNEAVYVQPGLGKESIPVHYKCVKRMSLEETDHHFYYYPGKIFITIDNKIGSLVSAYFGEKTLELEIKGEIEIHQQNEVSREIKEQNGKWTYLNG